METFIKVYIKSEEDLPKENGVYLCQTQDGIRYLGYYPESTELPEYKKGYWFLAVNWYLKPVELPEISDEEIRKECFNRLNGRLPVSAMEDAKCLDSYRYEFGLGWEMSIKWYRDELKKRMTK